MGCNVCGCETYGKEFCSTKCYEIYLISVGEIDE